MNNGNNTNKRKNAAWLLLTAFVSIALLLIYRICLHFEFFQYVLFSYMIILTVLVFVYIFYNRGFSRRGITEDMLPDDWDEDRKREFVSNGRDRLRKSKWMLMLIIAFFVTFIVDSIELFVLPMFMKWF